jgi:hypothetical protein
MYQTTAAYRFLLSLPELASFPLVSHASLFLPDLFWDVASQRMHLKWSYFVVSFREVRGEKGRQVIESSENATR